MTDLEDLNTSQIIEKATQRRVHDDNYVLNELKKIQLSTQDAFGKNISDGTTNVVDVAAHHPYNPERYRLRLNDAKVEPEDIPNQFTDLEAAMLLDPDAGNSITLQTAERPNYIVGYEAVASTASSVDSTLGDGDSYEIGLNDFNGPENGAYFEINGNAKNRLVLVGGGTEVASDTWEFPTEIDETDAVRYEIQYNWYNVGRYKFTVTYTDSSEPVTQKQQQVVVGELAVDDDFATNDGNYHIYHRLDATTSGQEVRAGSFGHIILGDITETSRTKSARLTGLSYGGSGEYEALAALRLDQDNRNIFMQLTRLSVFPGAGSGQLLIIVTKPDETDATGFSKPPEHSSNNSVVEQTTNISEFPDENGNIVTQTLDPNGYQVGFATFEESGTGRNTRQSQLGGVEEKRPIYDDNVVIVLYKADTANSRTINFTYTMEMQY